MSRTKNCPHVRPDKQMYRGKEKNSFTWNIFNILHSNSETESELPVWKWKAGNAWWEMSRRKCQLRYESGEFNWESNWQGMFQCSWTPPPAASCDLSEFWWGSAETGSDRRRRSWMLMCETPEQHENSSVCVSSIIICFNEVTRYKNFNDRGRRQYKVQQEVTT